MSEDTPSDLNQSPQHDPAAPIGSLESLLDDLPIPAMIYSLEGAALAMNRAAEAFWRLKRGDLIGNPAFSLLAEDTAARVNLPETIARIRQGERVVREPTRDVAGLGTTEERPVWYQAIIFPVRDGHGAISAMGYLYYDVTIEMEQREQLARTEVQIAAQRELIEALASPVVQVWEGVLLVPLVGAIDHRRAMQVTEQLLEAIVARGADEVILDVTGVPALDGAVAVHLINTARAARLLGAEVVLTGVRTDLAQTAVEQGLDLSQLVTRGTLQAGIAWALDRRALALVPRA